MSRIQRRFSFTNRVSIAESSVSARTYLTGDGQVGLQIGRIEFPVTAAKSCGKETWANARVICKARDRMADAYYSQDIGSVQEVLARQNGVHNAIMPGFSGLAGIKLSIRVVEPVTKRLITSIDDFRADNDNIEDREELFPLRTEDLGEESWKLDWQSDEVMLVVDTAVAEEMIHSPMLEAFVLPNALREVLAKAIVTYDPDSGPCWESKFVRFAETLAGPFPDDADPENSVAENWISLAVAAFAKKSGFKSKMLGAINIERNHANAA